MKLVSFLGWALAALFFAVMSHRELKHSVYQEYAESFIDEMDTKTMTSHKLLERTSIRYEECMANNKKIGTQLYVLSKPDRKQTLKIIDWTRKRRLKWEKNERPFIQALFSQNYKPLPILEKSATVFR